MMSVTSIRFLVRRAHAATQKSQQDSLPRIGLVLSPGVKLAPQSNALHDATNVLNLPMSRNDNIIMSHTRSKWWTRLWPESEDTGALLIDFFTVWAPGLECRSSVLGADAPLGALTAENHMRVLVPSRPWTRLDYSQPHIIGCELQLVMHISLPLFMIGYTNYNIFIKFQSSHVRNGLRKAKKVTNYTHI